MDDAQFSAAVVAVTTAFGDPTRRAIYLFARESDRGVTAAEVAERFELHPNVARHHLDKLAAGGYLDVDVSRGRGGSGSGSGSGGAGDGAGGTGRPGAGRPSKRYAVAAEGREPAFPAATRRDDLLVQLLGRALTLIPNEQAEAMAEAVGEEYGRSLAEHMAPGEGHRSFRNALHAVADALTAHGFAAHAEARGGSLAIIADQCPFGEAATQHPVICAVDRGMVRGMLATLYGDTAPTTSSSRAMGDDACVTSLA